MSPKKKAIPYRTGYKLEARYPKKGILLIPLHGAGPRCRVDFDPHDDGPWTTVQVMRIDDNQVEEYTCAMPCYYAVPLILINKRLAFFEAQSAPDGTPLPLEGGSRGATRLRLRELKEYTYLWRLRCRFLQAVFDMNHEPELDEGWRCDTIHGYVHRTYRRYGHDVYQRHTYWKDEIEAGRVPYSTPDIADMDWGAFIAGEMTASTRLNAFLWNRISQGYSRLVRDDPPVARWQAWRRGGTSRDLSASLFCTPPPSAPFPTPERGWMSVEPSSADEEREQGPYGEAAAQENGTVVQNSCSATLYDVDNDMECGSVIAATFDGSRVSALPSSQGADQAAASTGGTEGLGHRRISRLLILDDVPQGMALTDLLCTLSHVDDDHKPTLRVNYTSIS